MPDENLTNNPGATHPASEHIEERRESFKHATDGAAGTAHDAVDRAAERVHRGTDKVANAAGYAAEHSRAAYDSVKAHAGDWMDEVRDYVREKPAQSVAIAVAAGWLVGRLMRRR